MTRRAGVSPRPVCGECAQPIPLETVLRRNIPQSRDGWVARSHLIEIGTRYGYPEPSIRRAIAALIRVGVLRSRERGYSRGRK